MLSKSKIVFSELQTIRDFVRWGASQFNANGLFFGHGTDNALDEAAALVLHTLHQPYDLPDVYLDARLTNDEQESLYQIIDRRITERKPAAYLTQEIQYAGLSFFVDERVLVPRSPIAELIEDRFNAWIESDQVHNILDLCTGSGCIAIACSNVFPESKVDAVDVGTDALNVARINVEKHHAGDRVELICSDLFSRLKGRRYDVIVSNPPYVSHSEWLGLPKEYHAEPRLGFDGGSSGLDIVEKILAQTDNYLNDDGILVVEVGSSADSLEQKFPRIPFCWLEFQRGGDGVFLLTKQQLKQYF